jgi:hypothetical protein
MPRASKPLSRKPSKAAALPPAISATPPSLTHEQIAERAYTLFLRAGAVDGHDIEHWLAAEQELLSGSGQVLSFKRSA